MSARRKPARHPRQPVVIADDGVAQFKKNRIVVWMLAALQSQGDDLLTIAYAFPDKEYDDDYQQLMQLIGYSVSGYGDLRRSDKRVVAEADAEVAALLAASRRAPTKAKR